MVNINRVKKWAFVHKMTKNTQKTPKNGQFFIKTTIFGLPKNTKPRFFHSTIVEFFTSKIATFITKSLELWSAQKSF